MSTKIEVLRIGQRVVRDDRVTTHVALVARAFGASKIYMNEVNPEIKETIQKVNNTWGSNFEIVFVDNWNNILKDKKKMGWKIVHLTMYGQSINEIQKKIDGEESLFVVIGAEKVPRAVYDIADYNVSIGNQPHSEISALAVFLDRTFKGAQFERRYEDGQRRIIPSYKGKNVVMNQKRD